MRRRWKFLLGIVGASIVLTSVVMSSFGWRSVTMLGSLLRRAEAPVRIGLLHSQTGTMAISEKSILDAEILAIEEVNAAGGVAGRQVVSSAPDCRSDPNVFATEARRLIEQEQAVALFGCWNSESRKAVIPVVNEAKSLLFFPGNFEGIEKSSRVIYTGGVANQVILPAVRWGYDAINARRFFVVGLEEVTSRCGAEIAKDAIKAAGAEVVGESYTVPLTPSVDAIVDAIRQAKPDLVLNFLFGESNLAFYAAMRRAGLGADKLPIIAFGVGEDESRRFPTADIVGQYAAWNYFQSVPRPENREFVRRFQARYGSDRVIGDAMVAAYNGIKFWAQASNEVGLGDSLAVTTNLRRQSINAPDGIITIDAESQIAWRPFHLGRLRADNQFELVYSINKPVRPVLVVGTRSAEDWTTFLDSLKTRWRGRWSAGQSVLAPAPASPR